MRVVEIQVFTFSELSDEAKKVAIHNYREHMEFNSYFIIEGWKEKLAQYGFIDPKIYYSGFWSQGDGACFDCDRIDIELFNKAFNKSIPKDTELYIASNSNSNHYSHEMTRYIDCNYEEDEKYSLIVEAERLDLCKEIYKALEKEYDYQNSDEAISENIIANGYDFTIDGNIF